jgi:hypothetical protein
MSHLHQFVLPSLYSRRVLLLVFTFQMSQEMCAMETWRHGDMETNFRQISLFGIPRNSVEFREIPLNLLPIPTEVRKYESKKFRENSVPTEFRVHPNSDTAP